MPRQPNAIDTFARIDKRAAEHRLLGQIGGSLFFFLAGAVLFFHFGMFGSTEHPGLEAPRVYPPWSVVWPLLSGTIAFLFTWIRRRKILDFSYVDEYRKTRALLVDGMLLEKVLNEDAYERLPSLGAQGESDTGLRKFLGLRNASPGKAQDSFDRRMRDLVRNMELLQKDINWQAPATADEEGKAKQESSTVGCLKFLGTGCLWYVGGQLIGLAVAVVVGLLLDRLHIPEVAQQNFAQKVTRAVDFVGHLGLHSSAGNIYGAALLSFFAAAFIWSGAREAARRHALVDLLQNREREGVELEADEAQSAGQVEALRAESGVAE